MNWDTQISYWTIGGFEGNLPLDQAFDICNTIGSGIELSFGLDGAINPNTSKMECDAIKQLAAEKHISLRTMASTVFWEQSLTDPDPSVRKDAIAFTESYLQVAAWLELETVLIIPGYVAVPWDDRKELVAYKDAWDRATEAFHHLAPIAETLNVTMGLENVWNWFLCDPMSMKVFLDQFDSDWVGCYFDVANCLLNGCPEHWISLLQSHVKAVHVKNFERNDCAGGIHGFGESLHQGACNWSAVFNCLSDINYTGPLTAELIPFSRLPDLQIPDLELAQQGIHELNQLILEHHASSIHTVGK